ncbi:hypothetical protein MMC20_003479 [Loxospora ochrophaea]|nr:hypothetical protein [Loxospora ochrophaea]
MAIRPLTVLKLSVAIKNTIAPSSLFSREEVIRDQIPYCGYFLTVERDELHLIHQSAKDYLLRKTWDANPTLEFFRVKEDAAHLAMARKCFYYLQNSFLAAGEVNVMTSYLYLQTFPLASYAVCHWSDHAKSLACSEDIFNLSLPFYHKKSQVRESWLKMYFESLPDLRFPLEFLFPTKILSASITPLQSASLFGLTSLVKKLLKNSLIHQMKQTLSLNKSRDERNIALYLAVLLGHEPIVKLLLKNGVNIEAKATARYTALHMAAAEGHESMIQLLLEKGANIGAKDKNGYTALHLAARRGHESVIQILLEKGAAINAKDRFGNTALHEAAAEGDESVIQLLLENGANIEAEDKIGYTALHGAVAGGHESRIQLLLEKGANIEAKTKT